MERGRDGQGHKRGFWGEGMKAVLMSIHPKWCEKIFNGEKTVEVRKNAPKLFDEPFKVYVYMTKHRWLFKLLPFLKNRFAKVIGSFVCDRINRYNPSWLFGEDNLKETTCLDDAEIMDYIKYTDREFYLWRITEPKLFDKPKEIAEFWLYNDELNKRYERDQDFCCYDGTDENGEATTDCDGENINNCYRCWEEWSGLCHKLTRPPQSYCYVEVQK